MLIPRNVYYSIVAELTAIGSMLYIQNLYTITSGLILHLVACFLISIPLSRIIPERYRKKEKWTIPVLTLLGFFLLVVGYALLLFTTLYLLRFQRRVKSEQFLTLSLEDMFVINALPKERRMGESPLYLIERLSSTRFDTDKKIEAVSSIILNVNDARVIRKIIKLLGSENDEFRLFTFSKLNSIEKAIQDRIKAIMEKMEKGVTEEERAFLLYELAQSYYDLVYYGLVGKEEEVNVLKRAEERLKEALRIKKVAEFYILLGKIYIATKEYKKAEEALQRVSSFSSVHPMRYIPYLAEVLYRKGEYRKIRPLCEEHAEYIKYSANPYVYYCAEFWGVLDGSSSPKR